MDKEGVLRSFLVQTKVEAFSKESGPVVTLSDQDTVAKALKTLAENRFLAAPVLSHTPTDDDREIVCFLDIRDCLFNFLKCAEGAFAPEMQHHMLHRMRFLQECGKPFANTRIKDLPNKGSDGGFWLGKQAVKASLVELIDKAFLSPSSCGMRSDGKPSDHMHRVALFGNDGITLTSIITQSDVVRFLYEHVSQLGPIASATAAELGWVVENVVTVAPELPALDALLIMATRDISAVGVEKNGRLIGNFSMSDMRSITADHFCSLALPVGEFLALEHGTEYSGFTCSSSGIATLLPCWGQLG